MSKFKVGDKVAVRSGGYGKIVAIKPNGMYKIEGGGMEGSFLESELVKAANSCASSNPVVQNALKARNAVRINNIRDFDDLLDGVEEDMNNPDWGWDLNAERKLMAELRPYAQKFDRMSEWESVNRLVSKAKNSTAANADEYVVRKSLSTSKWLLSRRSKSLGNSGETKVFGSEQEARDFAKKNGLKVANAEVAKNAFYKTEEEAEYRAKMFIDAAINRIKGDFDDEINTVNDCIKLFKGAPMSDKAKADLERLKTHLATLKKCKAMF